MSTKKLAITLTIAVLGLILTATTTSVLGSPKGNSGVTGRNLDIFADSKGATSCTNISWGNVNANSSITKTVYVKNPNTYKLTLTIAVSNWTPEEAKSILSVTSDKNSYALPPGKIVPVVLTLAVGNTVALTDFDCIIAFSGTQ
jgi:hypothetical protein